MKSDGEILNQILKDRNLSIADLAKKVDRPLSTVYHWTRNRFIKSEVIVEICSALQMTRVQFYKYAEEDEQESLPAWISPQISEIIRKIRQLDENKQLMIWTTVEQLLKLLLNKKEDD